MTTKKKILSICMVAFMLMGLMPVAALAEGETPLQNCENHDTHDEVCGYTESLPEQPCTFVHEHDSECGYDGENADSCNFGHASHAHSTSCGFAPALPPATCAHSCSVCTAPLQEAGPSPAENAAPAAIAAARSPRSTDITASFTDANFKAEVYTATGKTAPEPIFASDVSGITALNVKRKNIASLAGIENFTALTNLNCSENQLTTLDVSALTALQELRCNDNQLTVLNLSGISTLTFLNCSANRLSSLNVNASSSLGVLHCYSNQISSLNVSGLTVLDTLFCQDNQLVTLDVSGLSALDSLACEDNRLTSLTLSGATALTSISCYSNQLTALDLTGLTNVMFLDCHENQLTTINIDDLANLVAFTCYSNQLTSIDLSNSTMLIGLDVSNNNLSALNVTALTGLLYLDLSVNQLSTLDVSALTLLEKLNCASNQLTALDVSALALLEDLNCASNQLSTLDVSTLTLLEDLNCASNQLTALNVSTLTALEKLNCASNSINTLDTSGITTLKNLDVSGNTAMISLDCSFAKLTTLDLSTLTALTNLDCSNNLLTALNLSGATSLTGINCSHNKLTAIDVSGFALTSLNCNNNHLLAKSYVTGFTGTWDGISFAFDPQDVVPYTVSFDPAGGTHIGGGALSQIVASGGNAAAPTLTRANHVFSGWDKPLTNIAASTTITAQWIPTYTVTFNPGGGTHTGGGALIQTVAQGANAIAPNLTWAGYTFTGWSAPLNNITANSTIAAHWTLANSNALPILKGANGTWQHGSSAGHVVSVDANITDFIGVEVDGAPLALANFTAVSGSTIVTLKPEYMGTLANGSHVLRILFGTGYAQTTVAVQAPAPAPAPAAQAPIAPKTVSPQTGDSANMPLWIALCGLSLTGASCAAWKIRRQQKAYVKAKRMGK